MDHSATKIISACICLLLAATGLAQEKPAPQQPPGAPAAKAEDVASLDAIIAAVYDVISGPAGQKRDWNRFRSLFAPGARLIPTGRRPTGEITARVLDVEQYIAAGASRMEADGFFEREIARRTETFSSIAHVFSTYESRRKADDALPFARGINSIQAMHDGKRWWIVTIFWAAERPDTPIPKDYLPPK